MFKKYDEQFKTREVLNSKGEYSISCTGLIVNAVNEPVHYQLNEDGDPVIELLIGGEIKTFKMLDLMAIHFKWIQSNIPDHLHHEIEGFAIDGNKTNLHASNVGYRFRCGKLEHPDYPGYYFIPEHSAYCLNQELNLLQHSKGVIRGWKTTPPNNVKNIKGGYFVFGYSTKHGYGRFSRHRSALMVFKGYPDNVDKLHVNHINGIPGDDRLENLEWCTPGENLDHAYRNNLRQQNFPILAKNLRTGEITEYHSMVACSNALGLSDMTVGDIVNGKKKYIVTRCGYTFKRKDDDRPWPVFDDIEGYIREVCQTVSVRARNCQTGEVFRFESQGDAERFTGVKSSTIALRLNKSDSSPCFGWQFIPDDGSSDFPDFTQEEYILSLRPSSYSIDARNLLTGETKTYSSLALAQKDHGKSTITRHIRADRQPIFDDGWQFKKEQDEWMPIEDPIEAVRRVTFQISAQHVDTGTILIFNNSLAAAKYIGGSDMVVRKHALNDAKSIYRGYRFCLGMEHHLFKQYEN